MDKVNHPKHYTNGSVECIDAIASAVVGKTPLEAVCVANIVKYLWRYNAKNGLEDVLKAKWYLDRLEKVVRSMTEYRDDAECRPAQVDSTECRPHHMSTCATSSETPPHRTAPTGATSGGSTRTADAAGGKTDTNATDEVLAANLA